MKRYSFLIFMVAFVAILSLNISSDVYASDNNKINQIEIGTSTDFKTNSRDILNEQLMRGSSIPTEFTKCPYDYEGSFEYSVFTNYYFSPNSNGELYLSIDATSTGTTTLKYVLYKQSNNKPVLDVNLGRYSSWDTTRLIYNLDVAEYYYFRFVNDDDTEQTITIQGSIYH